MIEKCAENGTWVFISTLKFPSFTDKIISFLDQLKKEGWVVYSFRLIFDLQGFSWDEIPDSFLFNKSIKFYLTEDNNEDMEGFNDVWANILNDDILKLQDMSFTHINKPNVAAIIDKSGLANLNLISGIEDS